MNIFLYVKWRFMEDILVSVERRIDLILTIHNGVNFKFLYKTTVTPKIENTFISTFRRAWQSSSGILNLRSYSCFVFYKNTQWLPKRFKFLYYRTDERMHLMRLQIPSNSLGFQEKLCRLYYSHGNGTFLKKVEQLISNLNQFIWCRSLKNWRISTKPQTPWRLTNFLLQINQSRCVK